MLANMRGAAGAQTIDRSGPTTKKEDTEDDEDNEDFVDFDDIDTEDYDNVTPTAPTPKVEITRSTRASVVTQAPSGRVSTPPLNEGRGGARGPTTLAPSVVPEKPAKVAKGDGPDAGGGAGAVGQPAEGPSGANTAPSTAVNQRATQCPCPGHWQLLDQWLIS
ncbi:hypothetical protein HDE_07879 [Halotydeus destructor]|nr:hypothetical protein HDE_07879 [Halotydeus destructor]